MNYNEIGTNIDAGRTSLRRLARHDEPEFSNASILNSMERFVRTVSEMEETILVPSRLLDLTVGDSDDRVDLKCKRGSTMKATLANTDLYRLYNIINQMKVELLWSQDPSEDLLALREDSSPSVPSAIRYTATTATATTTTTTNTTNTTTTRRLRHARCPSTTSMQSVQSASTSSDSESDAGIENDSGLENEDRANAAARTFRRHLRGLHNSIQRMTLAAEYLTMRYQADVGGQV